MSANEAVEQLAQSERGRGALRAIHMWLDNSGFGLDGANQAAVHAVLDYAWSHPLATIDAIEAAIGTMQETDQ